MEHIHPVHRLRHRVRVVAPSISGDAERACLIEILLRKHKAVRDVRVVAPIGSVAVRFDPKLMGAAQLLALIDRLIGNLGSGRLVSAELPEDVPDAPKTEICVAVEGMTCASCAALIQIALGRDPRIDTASVNFASETATIVGRLGPDEVMGRIGALGYVARPMDTLAQRRLVVARERERLALAKQRAVSACLLTLPVMAIGMAMPGGLLWRLAELALATPVVLGAGRPFFERAVALARHRTANMDTLIAIGSGAAWGHSVVSLMAGRHHLYFEAAAGIVSFVLLGRWLEERAKGKAGEAVRKLIDLQPATAAVLRAGGEIVVPVDEVGVGESILVRPGERIPLDGIVLSGLSAVDESLVTGESMPVVRGEGAGVIGGCINGAGALVVRVSATGADTVLAGIVRMVDHAQGSKLPIQRLADRVSAVFVPAVVGVSGITGALWLLGGRGFAPALDAAVSVLLIACPCALGLATPTAIMAAIGRAARQGIYIRDGQALETASTLSVLVLDKTGTITEGRPEIADFHLIEGDERFVLGLAAGAENGSEHHLGRAIVAFARARGVIPAEAESFEAVAGQGVLARIRGHEVRIGNLAFLRGMAGFEAAVDMAESGRTPVLLAIDGHPAAIFGVADRPRPGAFAAIRAIEAIGVRVIMATGDVEAAARHTAALVGIAEVVASASPARKLELVEDLRAGGAKVGMVGDGINDAPALAAADVGFAIGSGTDIAIESAAITLVGGDIAKVAEAILLSRRTMGIVRQNLVWAMGYNTIAIPSAAMGRLTPMVASMAMAASSVSVVANSLRLQR